MTTERISTFMEHPKDQESKNRNRKRNKDNKHQFQQQGGYGTGQGGCFPDYGNNGFYQNNNNTMQSG